VFRFLPAAAVRIGTPFVATEECDAHPAFKQVPGMALGAAQ
jgi:NAD(P)H-dependent flavin oxidoreductase YrpB (nitropropane dioxygenase family)